MQKAIHIILIALILLSDIATPIAYAKTPDPDAKPIQKAIASLTAKAKLSDEVLGVSDTNRNQSSAKKRLAIEFADKDIEDFKANEEILIHVNNPDNEQLTTKIISTEGEEKPVEIHTIDKGLETEIQINATNQFTPGKYTIEIHDQTGRTIKQDFTWGVLAMNTDQSIYLPNQTANLSFAVLDDKGDMVCDANVELVITSKNDARVDTLSTDSGAIKINPECTSHNFTLKPDYETSYQFRDAGSYELTLTAVTGNGTRSIRETIDVTNEDIPFVIKRTSATRIYPPIAYPMTIDITANEDFTGTVTETVPDSFIITPTDDSSSYDDMNTTYLQGIDPATALEKHVLGSADSRLTMPFDGDFKISQGFGSALTDLSLKAFYSQYGLSGHDGIDFALPMGTPLYAVDDGNIVWSGPGDYGTQVIIQHSWGKSYYGHMSKILVEKGFSVKKGSHIGYSGNTGESTGPHLHFGIKPLNEDKLNGYSGKIDPLDFLPIGLKETPLSLVDQQVLSASNSASTEQNDISAGKDSGLSKQDDNASLSASAAAFTVSDQEILEATVADQPNYVQRVKVISWDVQVKKGETKTLSYYFKTPQISPQFYLAGPLKFFTATQPPETGLAEDSHSPLTTVYEESRQWQIAADAVGSGWYNDGTQHGGYAWRYRKQVTIQDSQVPANQTNFPVVISLTSDTDLNTKAQADGDDILFTDSTGKTKLAHEIETYASGTMVAWVEVPTLNGSSNTTLYMYYGNPAASAQENAAATWDGGAYEAVYHTTETTNVTTVADSTGNSYTQTKRAAAGPAITTSGKNGRALDFERTNTDYTTNNSLDDVLGSGSFTISAWFRPEVNMSSGSGNEYHIIGLGDDSGTGDIIIYFFENTLIFKLRNSSNVKQEVVQTATWNAGTWYHIAAVWNSSSGMRLLVNGVLEGSNTFTARGSFGGGSFDLGRNAENGDADWWDGLIDDVHISDGVKSDNWLITEYNNQNAPGTFSIMGTEETKIFAPTNEQQMRHGKFFDTSGIEQPFVF